MYKILAIEDKRAQVFAHWLSIDSQRPGNSLFWQGDQASSCDPKTNEQWRNYLQLSLDIDC